jgi:hypothetical protein
MLFESFYKLSATQIYFDWVNNWLTMAEHYGVSVDVLLPKITEGQRQQADNYAFMADIKATR